MLSPLFHASIEQWTEIHELPDSWPVPRLLDALRLADFDDAAVLLQRALPNHFGIPDALTSMPRGSGSDRLKTMSGEAEGWPDESC